MEDNEEFIRADEEMLLRQLIKEHLERKLIYEGLISSYSPSFIFRKLKDANYKAGYKNKAFLIPFNFSTENKQKYEELNDFMDKTCGWKHSVSLANGHPTKNKLDFLEEKQGIVILQYEPKFDMETNSIPKVLYHLTTLDKLKKISKYGLTPKSSDNFFSFDDRIYLSKDIHSLYKFAKNKFFTTEIEDESEQYIEKHKFIILQVKPGHRMRFFSDQNFPQGVYTKENIDKFSIKPIEKIELNDEGDIIRNEDL